MKSTETFKKKYYVLHAVHKKVQKKIREKMICISCIQKSIGTCFSERATVRPTLAKTFPLPSSLMQKWSWPERHR